MVNPMAWYWTLLRYSSSGFCSRDSKMFLSPLFSPSTAFTVRRYCGFVQNTSEEKYEMVTTLTEMCYFPYFLLNKSINNYENSNLTCSTIGAPSRSSSLPAAFYQWTIPLTGSITIHKVGAVAADVHFLVIDTKVLHLHPETAINKNQGRGFQW